MSTKFEGYTLQDEIPRSQEYLRLMGKNSTIIIKSWPTDTLQFLIISNFRADVLDYRELRWKSLLSPVDFTLDLVKGHNMQVCFMARIAWINSGHIFETAGAQVLPFHSRKG